MKTSKSRQKHALRLLCAVLLLTTIPALAVPKNASAKNTVSKKNYLRSVVSNSTGLEKDFLAALEKQRNVDSLLESLGVMQPENLTPFGMIHEPNKAPAILQTDSGEVAAINYRKRLTWSQSFQDHNNERQIMIFDPSIKKWPGLQPITIVLADDKFKVLAWLESGGVPMFKTAVLEDQGRLTVLKVTSESRNSTFTEEQFEISDKAITKMTPQ